MFFKRKPYYIKIEVKVPRKRITLQFKINSNLKRNQLKKFASTY
jgi:hypothetical protein